MYLPRESLALLGQVRKITTQNVIPFLAVKVLL